jgi:DNA polymerase III delta subunit
MSQHSVYLFINVKKKLFSLSARKKKGARADEMISQMTEEPRLKDRFILFIKGKKLSKDAANTKKAALMKKFKLEGYTYFPRPQLPNKI